MSVLFERDNDNYLIYGSAIITGPPFSMAATFNLNNMGQNTCFVSLGETGDSSKSQLFYFDSSNNRIRMSAFGTGFSPIGQATTSNNSVTINTWHRGVGVTISDASRSISIDGSTPVSETTSVPLTGLNETQIGRPVASALTQLADGMLAEMAIWDAALSDDERAAYEKGLSPLFIRPQNLVSYLKLIDTNYTDLISGVTWSINGSPAPTKDIHPPGVIYPFISSSLFAAVAIGLTLDLDDSITMLESLDKQADIFKTDSMAMSDNLAFTVGLLNADSITLSESIINSFGLNKSDTINLSDIIIKESGVNFSDTINMSDNFNAIITLILSLNDTINMSDDLSKAIGISKADSINLTDNFSKAVAFIKTLADTVTTSDDLSKSIEMPFSDTITMSDNFNALVALILALNDSISMSDSLVSKNVGLNKDDTINITDDIIKAFGLTQSDIMTMSENFSSSADVIAALLDFVAKNRTFNFNAAAKIFNFTAKNKTFNFNAKSRGGS